MYKTTYTRIHSYALNGIKFLRTLALSRLSHSVLEFLDSDFLFLSLFLVLPCFFCFRIGFVFVCMLSQMYLSYLNSLPNGSRATCTVAGASQLEAVSMRVKILAASWSVSLNALLVDILCHSTTVIISVALYIIVYLRTSFIIAGRVNMISRVLLRCARECSRLLR